MDNFESFHRLRKLQLKRFLRQNMTEAENLLWQALRNKKLRNTKWRRQGNIGVFIADFICPEHKLIIEVDGGIHKNKREYDEFRSEVIKIHGYRVIRFTNNDVMDSFPAVLEAIVEALSPGLRIAHATPSPKFGEGDGG